MVELNSLNPLRDIGIGTVGLAILILVLAILIIALIGIGVFLYLQRKQLKYTIPLYRKIGGKVYKVAVFKAKDFKISGAGDKLWYVPRAKKYIPCGVLQSAPNEYTHFEREDGEWINIDFPDIDEEMKKAGVKFVNSDMRSQRIAISNILDQRFKGKQSFWDKYGNLITHLIFYLIVMVAMVVTFYQWGDIVERISALFDRVVAYENLKCPNPNGIVPAMIMVWFKGRKW